MTPRSLLRLVVVALCLSVSGWGQVSAASSVIITAKMPGSITLSMQSTPVYIPVQDGVQQPFEVPLTIQWNLNPSETPGFGVQAYFLNPQAALVEPAHAARLTADDVLARWGQNAFQSFRSGDAKVTLFQTAVSQAIRRGSESQTLALRISDEALASLPNGQYQGVLYLEVKNY